MENDDVDIEKVIAQFKELSTELGPDKSIPLVLLVQLQDEFPIIEEIDKNDKNHKKLMKILNKEAKEFIKKYKDELESVNVVLEWLSIMLHGSKSTIRQYKKRQKKTAIFCGICGVILAAAVAFAVGYNQRKADLNEKEQSQPMVSEDDPVEVRDKSVLLISPDPKDTDLRPKFFSHQIGNELILAINSADTNRKIYDNEIELKFSETNLATADQVLGLTMEVYASGTSYPPGQEVFQIQPFFILGDEYLSTDKDSQAIAIRGDLFSQVKSVDACKAVLSFDTRYLGNKYGNTKLHKLVLRFLLVSQNVEWIGFNDIAIIWNEQSNAK
jgi:hypothetical protein